MFSADYRAAVAAEAAGNVDLAAERYALAGENDGAVRMHLARAARAGNRLAEIGALRDAMRWAGEDPVLRRQAQRLAQRYPRRIPPAPRGLRAAVLWLHWHPYLVRYRARLWFRGLLRQPAASLDQPVG